MWLLWTIVIGILAGFLAGKIVRGHGMGTLMDLLVGIVGSVLGGWIFTLLGLAAYGLIAQLVMATVVRSSCLSSFAPSKRHRVAAFPRGTLQNFSILHRLNRRCQNPGSRQSQWVSPATTRQKSSDVLRIHGRRNPGPGIHESFGQALTCMG